MSALVLSLLSIIVLITPAPALESVANAQLLDLPSHGVGYAGIVIFTLAYAFVMAEEFTHLRQVKPTILVAGILSAMLEAPVRSCPFMVERRKKRLRVWSHGFHWPIASQQIRYSTH